MEHENRLLTYLHRVFDKDPERFLALRIAYDGVMTWRVQDKTLTTTVIGGTGVGLSISLRGLRVADLAAQIRAQPGYSVPFLDDTGKMHLSAMVLLNDDGGQSDGLYGYTSLLWAYTNALADELGVARHQIGQMLRQMSTTTARGEWLDEIGGYYAVPRISGEPDSSYSARIIAEVLRPRSNNVAIEEAITAFTGQVTRVTDVALWEAARRHDGTLRYDGVFRHDTPVALSLGLFDVEYGYDLIGGPDFRAFAQIVRDLVDRLRAAGTHMRSLRLIGSNIDDAWTLPVTDDLAVVAVALILADSFLWGTDAPPQFVAGMTLADSGVAPTGMIGANLSHNFTHSGVRFYNGKIQHLGVGTTAETV